MSNCCSACSYQLEQYQEKKEMTKFIDVREAHEYADEIRKAGVKRGLNASIQAMEELKAEYIRMGQPMAAGIINTVIVNLQALTIEQVEG